MNTKTVAILDVLADVATAVKKDAAEFSKANVAEVSEEVNGKTVTKKVVAKPTKQWLAASIKYELAAAQAKVDAALFDTVESML